MRVGRSAGHRHRQHRQPTSVSRSPRWNRGIEPYSFGVLVGYEHWADMGHTVLDRPLFRAGETVSMKHFLRRHVKEGITIPEGTAGKYIVTDLA